MDNPPHRHQDSGIERVRLLHGHTDPGTAYLVDDYPDGRVLRCRIRYWIDTATTGAKRGRQRFVSQTTNPKLPNQPWNKPHPATYQLRAWMYLDSNDHVQHTGVFEYGIVPDYDARLRLTGIYEQLSDADRVSYERLLAAASRRYRDPWQRWEDTIAVITNHLRAHGVPPTADNGVIQRDARPFYVGAEAYPVAVALARQHLSG